MSILGIIYPKTQHIEFMPGQDLNKKTRVDDWLTKGVIKRSLSSTLEPISIGDNVKKSVRATDSFGSRVPSATTSQILHILSGGSVLWSVPIGQSVIQLTQKVDFSEVGDVSILDIAFNGTHTALLDLKQNAVYFYRGELLRTAKPHRIEVAGNLDAGSRICAYDDESFLISFPKQRMIQRVVAPRTSSDFRSSLPRTMKSALQLESEPLAMTWDLVNGMVVFLDGQNPTQLYGVDWNSKEVVLNTSLPENRPILNCFVINALIARLSHVPKELDRATVLLCTHPDAPYISKIIVSRTQELRLIDFVVPKLHHNLVLSTLSMRDASLVLGVTSPKNPGLDVFRWGSDSLVNFNTNFVEPLKNS